MSKGGRRLFGFLFGTAVTWAIAVKPRVRLCLQTHFAQKTDRITRGRDAAGETRRIDRRNVQQPRKDGARTDDKIAALRRGADAGKGRDRALDRKRGHAFPCEPYHRVHAALRRFRKVGRRDGACRRAEQEIAVRRRRDQNALAVRGGRLEDRPRDGRALAFIQQQVFARARDDAEGVVAREKGDAIGAPPATVQTTCSTT